MKLTTPNRTRGLSLIYSFMPILRLLLEKVGRDLKKLLDYHYRVTATKVTSITKKLMIERVFIYSRYKKYIIVDSKDQQLMPILLNLTPFLMRVQYLFRMISLLLCEYLIN